jgi:adenylate cyclase
MGTASLFEAHPYIQSKMKRGYADYIVCPLFGKFIPHGAIALGTKHAVGFTDEQVIANRRLQAPLARMIEVEILHQNTVTLLSTYMGRSAGEKVMDGRILRGFSENITAVIMFADLADLADLADFADFTALSNALPPEQTSAPLNT